MAAKGITFAILAAGIVCLTVSSCTSGSSTTKEHHDFTGTAAGSARSPQESILGVNTSSEGSLPECLDSVVQRKEHVPTIELTIKGQPGDRFSYQVLKKDGSIITRKGDEFKPDQQDAIFTTGIPNSEVKTVTVTAEGGIGTP